MDVASGIEKRLSGEGRDWQPAFSPAGGMLAFLRAETDGDIRLWVSDLELRGARPMTPPGLRVGDYCWSPDGTMLAFSADVLAPTSSGAAGNKKRGPVRSVRKLGEQLDTLGWRTGLTRQIFLVPVAGDRPRQLTNDEVDCRGPVWSPDGERIAYIRGRIDEYIAPAGEPVSTVRVIALDQGRAEIWSEGLSSVCTMAWASDSRQLVAVGSEDTFVQAHVAGQLYRLSAGGSPIALTDDSVRPAGGWPPLVPTPMLHWVEPDRILFLGESHGRSHLFELKPERKELRRLRGGRKLLLDAAFTAKGREAVFLETTPHSPGTLVWQGRKRERVLAMNGAAYLADHAPAVMRRLTTVVHGCAIESRLLLPPHMETGRRYPLVVDLHGGPHAAFADAFLPLQQILATHGIMVLAVNPHGSTGHGREFLKAIHGHWGQIDCGDVLGVLEEFKRMAPVDPERIGLMGISYGGCLGAHLLAAKPEFRVAVLISPVVDLLGMYGAADIGVPYCTAQMRGGPGQMFGRYVRSSPLFSAGRVRSAVLLLHGEDDRRCPIGQSEAYFTALHHQGCVTELVRFAGCSHTLGLLSSVPPRCRHEVWARTLAWFEQHLCQAPKEGE